MFRSSKASQSLESYVLVLAAYLAQAQDCHNAVWCERVANHLTCATFTPPRGTLLRGGRGGGSDRVDCLMDIGAQTQGLATLFLIPTKYASGPVNDSNWTVVGNTLAPDGIVTILGFGEVGCQG